MIVGDGNVDLRNLALRYSKGCWLDGWKVGKMANLEDPNNPFLGSPEMLLAKGILRLEDVDGNMISITPMTRIRFRQLSDNALKQLGIFKLKETANPGADVIHPEYVETFDQLVSKSEQFLMNNFLAASAVLDAIISFLISENTTTTELIRLLEDAIKDSSSNSARIISLSSRASWIGRACIDGSWKNSKDFVFFCELDADVAKIDEYVAIPVILQFIQDLKACSNN